MIKSMKIPEGNKAHTLSGKGNKTLMYLGTALLLLIGLPLLTHWWEGKPDNLLKKKSENTAPPAEKTGRQVYEPTKHSKWIYRDGTDVPLPYLWTDDWVDPNKEDTIKIVFENTTDTVTTVYGQKHHWDHPAGTHRFFVNQDSLLITFTY